MSRNTKIVLGVGAGLVLLLCLCAGTIAAGVALFTVRTTSVTMSPDRVEQAAVRVGAQEPEGWRTDYAVRIGDIEVVGYRPDSGDGHIIYAYFGQESHADVEKLASDIENWTDGRYRWNRDEMRVVERRTVLLGDEEAELVISEGRGSSGAWKQAIIGYQSERGFTVAMLGLPAAEWSDAQLDAFIYSLK
ncbi:MAG: hypothetical protein MUC34_15470 [Anaerolineae bacterium]|jgi:hypothetical protein|nr:hypothetical protein [Anaerolineae bacterium]